MVASCVQSETGALDDKKADATYQRIKMIFPQVPSKDDIGLKKVGPWNYKPGAFFYIRSYDQTVTADAYFCVSFRATASSKSLKTLVFNICKYSVKVAL